MESNWIDRKDRLPELGQGVLVCLNTGLITIAYRTKSTGKHGYSSRYAWQLFGDIETSLCVDEGDQVTFWQPLPEPPKQ